MRQVRAARYLICATCLTAGCSANPKPLDTLLASIERPPEVMTDSMKAFRNAVDSYLRYLDDSRYRNGKLSLSEQKKFDVMSVAAIGLGTIAAIFGFSSDNDEDKAMVAGIAGAGSAFFSALIAKFQHGEDAEHARNCTEQIERILSRFEYPADPKLFLKLRDSTTSPLAEQGCLAADTR